VTLSIVHAWARQVGRDPASCAISTPARDISYAQLASRVAGYEATLGGPGTPPLDRAAMILCADPVEVIAFILGCMATGRPFAPVDVRTPPAVVESMVAALAPAMVIADSAGAGQLGLRGSSHLEIITSSGIAEGAWSPSRWLARQAPDNGYVYFTSGTTGRPKGIRGLVSAIEHFVSWEIAEFAVTSRTRVSQMSSAGFDAFLRDAFVPLCAGGTVCVPPRLPLVGRELAEWLASAKVAIAHCVPTVFRTLRSCPLMAGDVPALRSVLLAGEALQVADVIWWRRLFGDGKELVNLYGPSETTMVKLYHRVGPADEAASVIPAGRPIPGVSVRVLAADPPAAGTIGEIEITVPFRLQGYLDGRGAGFDPDGHRYRTGDLGRMRSDGELEVLGRRDRMLKVNGVRVEPQEVERVLSLHPAVTDACVIQAPDPGTTLVAYITTSHEVHDGQLLEHARHRLLPSSVPALLVRIPEIPRKLNGKVDHQRLPKPGGPSRTQPAAPPRGQAEAEIAAIWNELLGITTLGRDDDFFALGGDSLATAQLLDRLRARYGAEVPLRAFLENPTVAGLSAACQPWAASATAPLTRPGRCQE
jgi:acyl-coenzyme A synthetase/AMP-(fatty) acid ligase/acyl carrier protein